MPAPRRRGRFLTFEGLDGCGKTTQLKLLARALRRQHLPVLVTREPGGTSIGERIRSLLLRRRSAGMDPRTEVLLMFASRAQNVAECILPALAKGRIVLCDRFTDASLAYQGYGRGVDLGFIRQLDRFACRGLKPTMTFVLDINPRTSVRRARRRNTAARRDEGRFELETRAFYNRVRRGYYALARQEPHRVKLISGEDSIQAVHQKILTRVRPLLARRRRRNPR